MTEGDPYTEAASALPRNALKGQFDAQGLDKQAVGRVSRLAEFRENMEAMGQLGGSIESVIERYGVRKHSDDAKSRQDQARKKKGSVSDIVWLDLVGQLQAQIDAADERIQGHRDYFENKYGEDWAEKLALDILDEDSFPERRDGESITDYRRRIEDELFDEMFGPDGKLKPKYQDHPDAERFKQWARDREIKAGAGAKLDNIEREKQAQIEAKGGPLSQEEEAAIVKKEMGTATPEEALEALRLTIEDRDSTTYQAISDSRDELKDDVLTSVGPVASSEDGFGMS